MQRKKVEGGKEKKDGATQKIREPSEKKQGGEKKREGGTILLNKSSKGDLTKKSEQKKILPLHFYKINRKQKGKKPHGKGKLKRRGPPGAMLGKKKEGKKGEESMGPPGSEEGK